MSVLISRDVVREPLYAVVPLFNPWRFKSRYKHTKRAIKHFMESGAVVVLVEAGFNRRELVFADSGLEGQPAHCGILGTDHDFRHRYIGLHTKDELWLKENLVNIAVQRLPHDWQNVCWLDSDVHFVRPNWVGECIQKLQHYGFVQPFNHARDVGPDYVVLPQDHPHADGRGFIWSWQSGKMPLLKSDGYYYPPAGTKEKVWPGLSMAAARWAWDAVGGLQDYHVWGGGDWVMAHALVGKHDGMLRNDLHPNYKMLAESWFQSCERYIRHNVGSIDGSIFHFWHGPKELRGYNRKHALLAQIGFDPVRHLKRDSQGLWQLNDLGEDSHIKMRDIMREVARERDEDSTYIADS
jgi:hypothetical protein